MSTTAPEAIRHVVDTVGYIRVTVGEAGTSPADVVPADDARHWLPCRPLVEDPIAAGEVIDRVRTTRELDRDDVAASVFSLGYVFRAASIAIGAWLLDGVVLDMAPDRMWLRMKGNRPDSVFLAGPATVEGTAGLGALHASLVDANIARFVENLRRARRVGRRLLWANVGSACASSFGAFMEPLAERRLDVRRRTEDFFATARPELVRTGQVAHVGRGWAWERSACCLWYATPGGSRCSDCSLWSADERVERYDRILSQEGHP